MLNETGESNMNTSNQLNTLEEIAKMAEFSAKAGEERLLNLALEKGAKEQYVIDTMMPQTNTGVKFEWPSKKSLKAVGCVFFKDQTEVAA